jgi:hypothetical protein
MRRRILPYKTKADQEREKWMTLPEAVVHICTADGCDERAARHRLIAALADGARYLQHLKWEREPGDRPSPIGPAPMMIPMDAPPLGRAWSHAKIRWKTGRVRDDWGEYKPGKWRVLLISRYGISRLWPPPHLDAGEVAAPEAEVTEVRTSEVEVREIERIQADHPAFKEDTEAEYKARLIEFQQQANHCPSRAEDENWGTKRGIGRARVRELRANFLPAEVHKGGRRKRPPSAKLGGK